MSKTTGIVLETEMPMVEPGAATLYDMSRYHSDGAITGAVWVRLPSGLWVLDYDPGIPSYVEIPSAHTQLNFTSEDFSLIARINMDSVVAHSRLFFRGLANADGWYCYVQAGGSFSVITAQLAAFQETLSTVGNIIVGNWYTLGFSRSGATIITYNNGVAGVSAAGVHIDPLTCARTAKIGIHDNLIATPLNGKIAFLRIFSYALSAGQHLQMHEALRRWV